MSEKIEITALMLYYGRKGLAEEAVECFLRQTYPHKRLVIVNTHPDGVHFEKDYPDIEVHDIIPDTFENLNEKYNYAFSQIKTNWWAPWDSDDIWLPWHFENLAANVPNLIKSKYPGKVGINKTYFAKGNVIYTVGWQMWGDCIFETMDRNGNLYPHCNETSTDNCDRQVLLNLKWNRYWIRRPQYPLSFIFRWDEEGHGSSELGDKSLANQKALKEKMYATRHTEPFRPHWDKDYVQEVEDFNKSPRKYYLKERPLCSRL